MSKVALNSRSSYHNSVLNGDILPDPLFTTLKSPLTMITTAKGSGCSLLRATQTSLVPFRTVVRARLRRPGDYERMGCLCIYVLVSLFVCVFACVSVCSCVSLTSYACFYMSLCRFICVCLCVSMCLCVCLFRCGWCIYLCDYVSRMHLCVSACVHVQ